MTGQTDSDKHMCRCSCSYQGETLASFKSASALPDSGVTSHSCIHQEVFEVIVSIIAGGHWEAGGGGGGLGCGGGGRGKAIRVEGGWRREDARGKGGGGRGRRDTEQGG